MSRHSIAASEFDVVIELPLAGCCFGLKFEGDSLVASAYLDPKTPLRAPETPAQRCLVVQLERYLGDPHLVFDFHSQAIGTEFQQRVWQALQQIPVGTTRTYGEVAKALKSSAQAVGNACRANPRPLLVPCHRVVAANGVGGFMGQREGGEIGIKQALLNHERTTDGEAD